MGNGERERMPGLSADDSTDLWPCSHLSGVHLELRRWPAIAGHGSDGEISLNNVVRLQLAAEEARRRDHDFIVNARTDVAGRRDEL
jgi:2-methylisocitrate lyase-like PEP mutase family enzyme